jgi:Ulp1 family protease
MKSKQITILDSLRKGNHKQTYGIAFFALLELANLIFCSQYITFVPSEWKLIISFDSPQQKDGHNCGLFVILNLASIFSGQQLRRIENPDRARQWIYHLINNYRKSDEKEAQLTYLPTIVPLNIQEMNIQEISTTDYFYSLIKDIRNQKSSFRCAFKDC